MTFDFEINTFQVSHNVAPATLKEIIPNETPTEEEPQIAHALSVIWLSLSLYTFDF